MITAIWGSLIVLGILFTWLLARDVLKHKDQLKIMVIIVILYTSFIMFRDAFKKTA